MLVQGADLSTTNLKSTLAALKWIDSRLEYPERRASYDVDRESGRAVFGLEPIKDFQVTDHMRTDVAMARFFASKVVLDDKNQFNSTTIDSLKTEGYVVSAIVWVGDDISSWLVIGKHFALEMRNPKFG